jgi:hypothetical protein
MSREFHSATLSSRSPTTRPCPARWMPHRAGLIAGLALALLVPACDPTESRHFGLQVSVDGDLIIRFRHCVEPPARQSPARVSVYSVGGGDERLWAIVEDTPNRHAYFPMALKVGETPSGYRMDMPLVEPIPHEGRIRVSFSAGEAWYESLEFKLAELRADMVLTFDRRYVSPEEFYQQAC